MGNLIFSRIVAVAFAVGALAVFLSDGKAAVTSNEAKAIALAVMAADEPARAVQEVFDSPGKIGSQCKERGGEIVNVHEDGFTCLNRRKGKVVHVIAIDDGSSLVILE